MTTSGFVMMIVWCGAVTLVTAYFLFKVLTTKKKEEPDSYINNDDKE